MNSYGIAVQLLFGCARQAKAEVWQTYYEPIAVAKSGAADAQFEHACAAMLLAAGKGQPS